MALKKVTMRLSERDISNAEKVRKAFNTGNNAGAASSALSISAELANLIDERGEELYLHDRNGFSRRVTISRGKN